MYPWVEILDFTLGVYCASRTWLMFCGYEEGRLSWFLCGGARSNQSYVRVVRTGRIYPILGSQSAYQKREDGGVRRT